MSWKKFKYVYIGLFVVFMMSSIVSYYLNVDRQPLQKPNETGLSSVSLESFQITDDINVIMEKEYDLCVRYDLNCDKENIDLKDSERKRLNQLSLNDIKKIYPKEENWEVKRTETDQITIIKKEEGLCPVHSQIWHLGLDSSLNYVAVYYGPRETENLSGVYKVTDIPVSSLPIEYQNKIKNYSMEFYTMEELVAILDSLSEHL
ncbi:hypothetical protein [Desulfonispora thiosulfatigenes]|nr:hypothetical protein [Desulfonispora thiosulfatigenes]